MVEWDTYRVGIDCLSTTSTMHGELSKLKGVELAEQKQQNLASQYYERSFVGNYQALRRIFFQRRNHRHLDWQIYCDWFENVVHSEIMNEIQATK